MNQNQKISIVDDPKLRKEIALKIAAVLDETVPKLKGKITEEKIDALINRQDIVKNYHLMEQINQKQKEMFGARENSSVVISVDQNSDGIRYGYVLYDHTETKEDQINNREIDILTENDTTRQKLKNNLILDELNMDIKLLFPENDTQALEQYLNNPRLIETGFLFTENDLLCNLNKTNPELCSVCNDYLALFQGNYTQNVAKDYKYIMTALVPTDGLQATELLPTTTPATLEKVIEVLLPYANQIKELERLEKLPDHLKKGYAHEAFMQMFQTKFLSDATLSPVEAKLKEMFKANVIKNNMPFTKVFTKDGKNIPIREAAQYYNEEKKEFESGVKIEDIDPKRIKEIQDVINFEKVKADAIYFKHIQFEIQNKEYKGDYTKLKESIENYLNQYNDINNHVQELVSKDPSLNMNELMKDEIAKLSASPIFRNLERSIQNDIHDFNKDIFETNETRKQIDIQIKDIYRFNLQMHGVINNYGKEPFTAPHDDFYELGTKLNETIQTIENKRIELAANGDKESIRKANEYYYKAYQELLDSNLKHDTEVASKSYNDDCSTYRDYYSKAANSNVNDIIEQIKYYAEIEKPQTQFEKDCIKQMNDFIKEMEATPEAERKQLLSSPQGKLALRVPCIHYYARSKQMNVYAKNYNRMDYFRSLSEQIENKDLLNDYSIEKNQLDQIISNIDTIEKDLSKIENGAERLDVEAAKLEEFFKNKEVNTFLDELFSKKEIFDLEKTQIEEKCKDTPKIGDLKAIARRDNYKTCDRMTRLILNREQPQQENDIHLEQYNALKEKFSTDPDVSKLPQEYYKKNDEHYLSQSLKALSILNIKHEEYLNRGTIGKWWYKKSHNRMIETRTTLIDQLHAKGVELKNPEQLGLDELANSYSKTLHQEIHRETIKETSINDQITKLYDEKIKAIDPKESNKDLQNKVKNDVDIQKDKNVSTKVENKEIEVVEEKKVEMH